MSAIVEAMANTLATGAGPTPGPWRVVGEDWIEADAKHGRGGECCVVAQAVSGTDSVSLAERDANARLIAASPALLAALSNAAHRIGQLSLMAKQAREILARETVTQAELRDARGFLLSIEQEKTEEYDAIIAGAEGGAA